MTNTQYFVLAVGASLALTFFFPIFLGLWGAWKIFRTEVDGYGKISIILSGSSVLNLLWLGLIF